MTRGCIHFFKKYKLAGMVLVVVLAIAGVVAAGYFKQGPKYETVAVTRGTITQEVSVTGKVVPVHEVELSFEKNGTVAHVYKNTGDMVLQGDVIVALDTSELEAQLAQGQAQVASVQAKLDELKQGSRPEQIAVNQAQLSAAQIAFSESQKGMVNAIQSAYTVSDDAIHNGLDQIFINPRTATPQVLFLMSDMSLQALMETNRYLVEQHLNTWNISLNALTTTSDLELFLNQAKRNMSDVKDLLDASASAVNGLTPYGTFTQTTINGWRASLSTARTSIDASIASIATAENTWKTAQANVIVAQTQLSLTQAGSSAHDIAAQQAQVASAQANIQEIRAQMNKMSIRAPFTGTVTHQDAKIGEGISVNQVLVGVISNGLFQMEANIPEVDIAKVSLRDHAKVTLDAYGSDVVFPSHVVSIDPTEIVQEGVATYKTTMEFDSPDDRVKSGMTANIDILTARKDGVLTVPQRVIIGRGPDTFVDVLDARNKSIQRPVQTGLRGSDGNIEIVSGLSEGERVITSVQP